MPEIQLKSCHLSSSFSFTPFIFKVLKAYQSLILFFLMFFQAGKYIFFTGSFIHGKAHFFFSEIYLLNFQSCDNSDVLSKYLHLQIFFFHFRHNNNKTPHLLELCPMLETFFAPKIFLEICAMSMFHLHGISRT